MEDAYCAKQKRVPKSVVAVISLAVEVVAVLKKQNALGQFNALMIRFVVRLWKKLNY